MCPRGVLGHSRCGWVGGGVASIVHLPPIAVHGAGRDANRGGPRPTVRFGSQGRRGRRQLICRPGSLDLVSYPSSAPHNSRHGPLVDFVPTGGKPSALAYATVSLFDVDRHWSIGPRQERVDLCHVFPGRHTSSTTDLCPRDARGLPWSRSGSTSPVPARVLQPETSLAPACSRGLNCGMGFP